MSLTLSIFFTFLMRSSSQSASCISYTEQTGSPLITSQHIKFSTFGPDFNASISFTYFLLFSKILDGDFNIKVSVEDLIKGITEANIRTEIIIEHIGSDIYQSKYFIRSDEMITPNDPNASANICRKTPYMFSL